MDHSMWWAQREPGRAPPRTTIHVEGELDLDTGPRLRNELVTELGQLAGDDAELVLDLAAVTFCDSSGLQALLATLRRARLLDRRLTLVVVPESRLERFLTLAGVRDLFSIVAPQPPPSA